MSNTKPQPNQCIPRSLTTDGNTIENTVIEEISHLRENFEKNVFIASLSVQLEIT